MAVVPRPGGATAPVAQRPADDVDLRIGSLVASLVPDGATLQFGPGGIGEGIASALERPVRIRSGLLTDAMAALHDAWAAARAGDRRLHLGWRSDRAPRRLPACCGLVSVTETNDSSADRCDPAFRGVQHGAPGRTRRLGQHRAHRRPGDHRHRRPLRFLRRCLTIGRRAVGDRRAIDRRRRQRRRSSSGSTSCRRNAATSTSSSPNTASPTSAALTDARTRSDRLQAIAS